MYWFIFILTWVLFPIIFPAIPKIVQINSAADSLEISWDTIESDTIYYKLLVKQGENIVFEETIKEVPYKLKGLKTGETYIAYLSVCSEKKCHQSAEGTVLKTTAEGTNLNVMSAVASRPIYTIHFS